MAGVGEKNLDSIGNKEINLNVEEEELEGPGAYPGKNKGIVYQRSERKQQRRQRKSIRKCEML